jgi:SAM-dependent methyltransferase
MRGLRVVLLRLLHHVNEAHPWSHNDAYAPLVVLAARRVRRAGGTSALDIGCGTGHLVTRLAHELPDVTGLEADKATADLAAAATAHLPAIRIEHGLFPQPAARRFDLVSMVAVLHHLPLIEGVRAARQSVAPGGRLVVVGAFRETLSDWPLSLLSLALNPLIGMALHPRRAGRLPQHMTAPVAAAPDTYRDIACVLRAELPGVSIHRGLFWRYVAIWVAPLDESAITQARVGR